MTTSSQPSMHKLHRQLSRISSQKKIFSEKRDESEKRSSYSTERNNFYKTKKRLSGEKRKRGRKERKIPFLPPFEDDSETFGAECFNSLPENYSSFPVLIMQIDATELLFIDFLLFVDIHNFMVR